MIDISGFGETSDNSEEMIFSVSLLFLVRRTLLVALLTLVLIGVFLTFIVLAFSTTTALAVRFVFDLARFTNKAEEELSFIVLFYRI